MSDQTHNPQRNIDNTVAESQSKISPDTYIKIENFANAILTTQTADAVIDLIKNGFVYLNEEFSGYGLDVQTAELYNYINSLEITDPNVLSKENLLQIILRTYANVKGLDRLFNGTGGSIPAFREVFKNFLSEYKVNGKLVVLNNLKGQNRTNEVQEMFKKVFQQLTEEPFEVFVEAPQKLEEKDLRKQQIGRVRRMVDGLKELPQVQYIEIPGMSLPGQVDLFLMEAPNEQRYVVNVMGPQDNKSMQPVLAYTSNAFLGKMADVLKTYGYEPGAFQLKYININAYESPKGMDIVAFIKALKNLAITEVIIDEPVEIGNINLTPKAEADNATVLKSMNNLIGAISALFKNKRKYKQKVWTGNMSSLPAGEEPKTVAELVTLAFAHQQSMESGEKRLLLPRVSKLGDNTKK